MVWTYFESMLHLIDFIDKISNTKEIPVVFYAATTGTKETKWQKNDAILFIVNIFIVSSNLRFWMPIHLYLPFQRQNAFIFLSFVFCHQSDQLIWIFVQENYQPIHLNFFGDDLKAEKTSKTPTTKIIFNHCCIIIFIFE